MSHPRFPLALFSICSPLFIFLLSPAYTQIYPLTDDGGRLCEAALTCRGGLALARLMKVTYRAFVGRWREGEINSPKHTQRSPARAAGPGARAVVAAQGVST